MISVCRNVDRFAGRVLFSVGEDDTAFPRRRSCLKLRVLLLVCRETTQSNYILTTPWTNSPTGSKSWVSSLARTLKPLTKSTTKMWSDQVISPLVFVLEKNFSEVLELREVIRHANYDTRACHEAVLKTAIRRSLQSMAPP